MHVFAQLLEFENVDKLFPSDVIKRAKEYLNAIPGGTGAYSDSQGAAIIREQIAEVKPWIKYNQKRSSGLHMGHAASAQLTHNYYPYSSCNFDCLTYLFAPTTLHLAFVGKDFCSIQSRAGHHEEGWWSKGQSCRFVSDQWRQPGRALPHKAVDQR